MSMREYEMVVQGVLVLVHEMVDCVVPWHFKSQRFCKLLVRTWRKLLRKSGTDYLTFLYVNDIQLSDMRFVIFVAITINIVEPARRLDNILPMNYTLPIVLSFKTTNDNFKSGPVHRLLQYNAKLIF